MRSTSCSQGLRGEKERWTDNPNIVCWVVIVKALGLWEHGREYLTQSGEPRRLPGRGGPDLVLGQAPHWADDMPHL